MAPAIVKAIFRFLALIHLQSPRLTNIFLLAWQCHPIAVKRARKYRKKNVNRSKNELQNKKKVGAENGTINSKKYMKKQKTSKLGNCILWRGSRRHKRFTENRMENKMKKEQPTTRQTIEHFLIVCVVHFWCLLIMLWNERETTFDASSHFAHLLEYAADGVQLLFLFSLSLSRSL